MSDESSDSEPTGDEQRSDKSTSNDESTKNEPTNDGQRFDRLPATADEREVSGRATRREVLDWWEERFRIPPETFDDYSFWEKGKGKIWVLYGDLDSPVRIEALGMTFLRTRQRHWKPTTNAAQRFGRHATTNVIELDHEQARRFARGDDQELDWDGDWGYLIVAHELAGGREPLGVGLYLHGELQSLVPQGRQRDL